MHTRANFNRAENSAIIFMLIHSKGFKMAIRCTLRMTSYIYLLVAVTSSGILKAKQKLGVTFNPDKLGVIDFTKFSKLTMCSA